MDSRGEAPDRISRLSDYLLVLIISSLPFKDALKTSALSRRWRYLYRETRNIVFKEAEIVTYPVAQDEETRRANFVRYIVDWVSNFPGGVIETFELCLSRPVGFETEIKTLIDFAASKNVKNLRLDFSSPLWINRGDAEEEEASMIQIPESVYKLTSLVSLKLFACRFDPSRLAEPGSVTSLWFGWIQLATITSLISKTPLLENLRIKNCWNVGLGAITGYNNRLTKLVFKRCLFAVPHSTLDLPNIQIFKFSGKFHPFYFVKVNRRMEEAYLDFGEEMEFDGNTGTQLRDLLYNLLSARTLTVCPFLIQLIQDSEDPVRLDAEMETKQLVLKTNLEPHEFVGIRLLINSCPHLETLSFQMVAPRLLELMAIDFDPETYWGVGIIHECLENTLKNVQMWNFCGDANELHVLRFLMQYGRVLEQVDLYPPSEASESRVLLARAAAETVGTTFEASSENLTISLH